MTNTIQNLIALAIKKGFVPEKKEEYSFKGDKPEKCDMICDHCVCWCGQEYACCNCGLKFIPQKWLNQTLDSYNLEKIIELALEKGYADGYADGAKINEDTYKIAYEKGRGDVKKDIEEELLIKCECETGGCANCLRVCQLLDNLSPNKEE